MFRKKYISLEFGEQCIKVGLAAHIKDEEFESLNSVVVKTPPSVYGNGRLLNMDTARDLVLETMKQNRFKASEAVIYISNSAVFRKELAISATDAAEVEKLAHREIKLAVPPEFGDFMLQHKVLGTYVDQGVRKTQIFAAAVRKAVISDYLDLAIAVGLTPEVLDLYSEIAENPFGSMQTIDTLEPLDTTPKPKQEKAPAIPKKTKAAAKAPAPVPLEEPVEVEAAEPVIEISAIEAATEELLKLMAVEQPEPPVQISIEEPIAELPVELLIELPIELPVELPDELQMQGLVEDAPLDAPAALPALEALPPLKFTNEPPVLEVKTIEPEFKPVFDNPVSKPVGGIPPLESKPYDEKPLNTPAPAADATIQLGALPQEPTSPKADMPPVRDLRQPVNAHMGFYQEEGIEELASQKQAPQRKAPAKTPEKKKKALKLPDFRGMTRAFERKKQDFVSLEFGAQNIRIVAGICKGSEVKVLNACHVDMPEDAFDDGKLLNTQAVKEVLKNTLRLHNIRSKNAVVSISSTGAISRELILPTTDEDEMDKIVPFEAKQFLPIEFGEYIIQYKPIDTVLERNVAKTKVMVAAVQKSIVESYLELVRAIDLKPVAMDLCANAMAMLFKADSVINEGVPVQDKTIALIDIGHKYLTVNILGDGELKFSRIIEGGGFDLNVIISDVVGVSVQDAERMKIKARHINEPLDTDNPDDLFLDSIKMIVDTWAVKIQRIFMFYESRNRGKRISEVFLYGGSASLDGLTESLTASLNVPVSQLQDVSSASLPVDFNNTDLKIYMNAIGAIAGNR